MNFKKFWMDKGLACLAVSDELEPVYGKIGRSYAVRIKDGRCFRAVRPSGFLGGGSLAPEAFCEEYSEAEAKEFAPVTYSPEVVGSLRRTFAAVWVSANGDVVTA